MYYIMQNDSNKEEIKVFNKIYNKGLYWNNFKGINT